MVEGLIGKKIGMTQTFDEQGNVAPVTVIKVGPCTVIQKKTKEKDGYSALQLGLVEEKGMKKAKKPLIGHYNKSGIPPLRILREFRFEEEAQVKEGDQFFVDIFQVGEKVHVIGTSKGKGFAGVVKRWGYHGGKASHGSMFHRAPGSVGASAFPSRVVKGKKLPGHMGNTRVTVRNLTVIQADKGNNLLVVKGAVPGARGGYLLIKKADFHPRPSKLEPSEPEKPKAKQVEQPKAEPAKQPEPEKLEKAKPEQPKPEQPETKQPEPEAEKPEQEQPEPKDSKAEKPEQPEPEKPEHPKPDQPEPEPSKPEHPEKEQPEAKKPEPEAEKPEKEQPEPKQTEPKAEKPEQPEPEKPESEPSQPESSKEEKKEK